MTATKLMTDQDLWVCPCCLGTYANSNAATFMTKDANGVLECSVCHGANFIDFERWSPRLELTFADECYGCYEPIRRDWVCVDGLGAAWGDSFYDNWKYGEWKYLYLVGTRGQPSKEQESDYRVASRKSIQRSWENARWVPTRLVPYANWLDTFGPVTEIYIRLDTEHYTQ